MIDLLNLQNNKTHTTIYTLAMDGNGNLPRVVTPRTVIDNVYFMSVNY